MTTGMALIVGGLIFLAAIIVVVTVATALKTHLVPQNERLVVYRLGSFDRLAGPGPVQIISGIDEIVGKISLDDLPIEVNVSNISIFGVADDLTLKFWCRFDPAKVAKIAHNTTADLVRANETQRSHQIELKTREVLLRHISRLQERIPLPDKATVEERVAALAPGTLRHNTLLQGLKYELEQVLSTLGVGLSTTEPVWLTGRNAGDRPFERAGVGQRGPGTKYLAPAQLTKEDLAVLKPVPRETIDKRLSA